LKEITKGCFKSHFNKRHNVLSFLAFANVCFTADTTVSVVDFPASPLVFDTYLVFAIARHFNLLCFFILLIFEAAFLFY